MPDESVRIDAAAAKTPRTRPRRWLRVLLRVAGAGAGILLVGCIALYVMALPAIGVAPEGERLERMMASPRWADGEFINPQLMDMDVLATVVEMIQMSPDATPDAGDDVPVVEVDPGRFAEPPGSGLRITWLGHSTTLIEIDGVVLLTDPVWGPRASPLSWLGPKRWYDPLISLTDLPEVDAVLISHDHYDHLDHPTILAIREWEAPFIVPLGVGAHLAAWGIPEERIVELDWWERHGLGDIEIVSAPARHASGRGLFDTDRTLWAGYAVHGPDHRVFFSGDTGMFPGVAEIGERLGPFDVTMIEVGAYAASWRDWHMGPEQAVEAHSILGGEVLLPIHWGLFNLSTHGWTEPIERVVVHAEANGVTALTPRPGESYEPGRPMQAERWWPDLPWRTVAQYPVVSTQLN